jgi:tetratricopeptide (TPR) repeat protein
VALYRRALQLDPGAHHVMNNLGAVYLLQSKDQLALSTLTTALSIDRNMVEALANAATVLHVSESCVCACTLRSLIEVHLHLPWYSVDGGGRGRAGLGKKGVQATH